MELNAKDVGEDFDRRRFYLLIARTGFLKISCQQMHKFLELIVDARRQHNGNSNLRSCLLADDDPRIVQGQNRIDSIYIIAYVINIAYIACNICNKYRIYSMYDICNKYRL